MAGLVPAIYVFGHRRAKKGSDNGLRQLSNQTCDRQGNGSALPLPLAGEGWGGGSIRQDLDDD
jgi:hypothetical protein